VKGHAGNYSGAKSASQGKRGAARGVSPAL
jgi:hypothetical protein